LVSEFALVESQSKEGNLAIGIAVLNYFHGKDSEVFVDAR